MFGRRASFHRFHLLFFAGGFRCYSPVNHGRLQCHDRRLRFRFRPGDFRFEYEDGRIFRESLHRVAHTRRSCGRSRLLRQFIKQRESWQPFWRELWRQQLSNLSDCCLCDDHHIRPHAERTTHRRVQYVDEHLHDYDGPHQRHPVHDVGQHLQIGRRLCRRGACDPGRIDADFDHDNERRSVRIRDGDCHVHV